MRCKLQYYCLYKWGCAHLDHEADTFLFNSRPLRQLHEGRGRAFYDPARSELRDEAARKRAWRAALQPER